MIQMSPATPGGSSFGGGQPYGTATGRTASFGYGSLEGGGARQMRGPMPMAPKSLGGSTQLLPDQPIGIQNPVEAPVRIGSGSWLGANAIVLPGSTIGEHVVVAAGAVVRGEIPDHCVVAGVPAKIIRRYVAGHGWIAAEDPA